MNTLTPTQVAKMLGVDSATVRRWAANGRLPAVKVGARWRIHRDEVDRIAHSLDPRNRKSA